MSETLCCLQMVRFTEVTAEMTEDHSIYLKQGKRTCESNSIVMLGLLLLLTFPSLFLFFVRTPQPLYKSAQKTMWALAGSTVSFEW